MKKGLRLPRVLSVAVLVAAAACADDNGTAADAAPADVEVADVFEEHYFCIQDDTFDGGGVPTADANPCGQVVTNPDDCPEGCRPVG